jgi:hypothetical protein
MFLLEKNLKLFFFRRTGREENVGVIARGGTFGVLGVDVKQSGSHGGRFLLKKLLVIFINISRLTNPLV